MLVLGDHGEKAAVSHQPCAIESGFDAIRKRRQGGVVVRRPHHASMQQTRGAKIVHESRRTGDVRAQMERLDVRGPCRLHARVRDRRDILVDRKREGRIVHELSESKGPIGLAGANQPVVNLQGLGLHPEAACRPRDQLPAGGGRGETHRATGLLHRVAARGIAFVG